MKELTKEQAFSVYLPYNTKVFDYNNSIIFNMIGLNECYANCMRVKSHKLDTHIDCLSLALRPLSDLTEDEWKSVLKSGCSDKTWDGWCWKCSVNNKGGIIEFNLPNNKALEFRTIRKSFHSDHFSFNQFAAFQKLASLHADFQGLIEKGWAVDETKL